MKAIRWAVAACVALTFTSPRLARAGAEDQRLDVYWNDTEGGAATLIVTPAGESVLVDSGNAGERDAKRIFATATAAGLKKIDYLVTTHFHGDHFGGAAALSQLIPIGTVYDNGEFPGGRERPGKAYLEFKADKRLVLNPGDEIPLKQGHASPKISLRCLGARQKFVEAPAGAQPNTECGTVRKKLDDASDNANSIVQVLSFGDFRLLLGGDLTWNVETKLVCPVNLVGKVDVYQVTHHGLDISNNPAVVKSLAPTVAVFSNGPTKGAGPETFETIKAQPTVQGIYEMHKNTDGKGRNVPDEFIANVKTGDGDAGNYIKLSADPTAKAYAVTIPATKHEMVFQTTAK